LGGAKAETSRLDMLYSSRASYTRAELSVVASSSSVVVSPGDWVAAGDEEGT
jgi:hypothetical protein